MSAVALTRVHREFIDHADRYRPKPGTPTNWDGNTSKGKFKDDFIAGYAEAIKAAARQYDLPAPLVAAVAYRELGNDDWRNDLAYALRAADGRSIPGEALKSIRDLNTPRDETSYGPYNIQVRRAAQILGYGNINTMPETARRMLIPTLRDPVAATFMLAKHLSDLRNVDFRGVAGRELSVDQLAVIAERYNQVPEKTQLQIRAKIGNGRKNTNFMKHAQHLLKR